MDNVAVYLEIGMKRTFAGAIEWPGWCRSGRDEATALQALIDYGPRYARAIRSTRLDFEPPIALNALTVVEKLPGTFDTNFGVPAAAPAADAQAVTFDQLRRLIALLRASWRAFDEVAEAAASQELRKGPRGGGRDLDQLRDHVRMAEAGYLRRLGAKLELPPGLDLALALRESRKAILRAVEHAAEGQAPILGPRGGVHWTARYFVRRAAWHILDHAWEIEDRVETSA